MNKNFSYSELLNKVPEYPFAKVGRIAKEVEEKDQVSVINVRMGIPDWEAPKKVKEAMAEYILKEKSTYGYPCDVYPERGIDELIRAIIKDYRQKYGVNLKPENIAVTNWTKEALHNLARLVGKGNILVPEPVYPAYIAAVILSGHSLKIVPTSEKSNWLPDFEFQDDDIAFYFCDPNNPTGVVATKDYYLELLKKLKEKNIIGIFDKAYKDYVLDEKIKPISITQIPELMDYGFEVVSFSKHYNFVGIGVGWLISSKENIDRWLKLSSQFSQGAVWAKQMAGVIALTEPEVEKEVKEFREELKQRRDIFIKGLKELALECQNSSATPYLWIKTPLGYNDEDFVLNILLKKAHVAFMPGSYFGESGKGYFRATLFLAQSKIKEVLSRIKNVKDW